MHIMKIIDVLKLTKDEIESLLANNNRAVYRYSDLGTLLLPVISKLNQRFPQNPNLDAKNIIKFLISESIVNEIQLNLYRIERVYTWKSFSIYELLPTIKPNGFYSHITAAYFHELIVPEPENIIFNNEQSRSGSDLQALTQGAINYAFKNKQRLTNATTYIDGKKIWYINGKNTNNYGVTYKQIDPVLYIPLTNIERTLIDIVVRPYYGGGPRNIVQAYKSAKGKFSIQELERALRELNYKYPYYQAIGFYLEMAKVYDDKSINRFQNFDKISFDFYLDYQIQNPLYNPKWRIFYPAELS